MNPAEENFTYFWTDNVAVKQTKLNCCLPYNPAEENFTYFWTDNVAVKQTKLN
jgi:outer membrane protein W